MKITQLLASKRPAVSFEFFPPKTEEGVASLMETVTELRELKPAFVTMTYGAGGSTRARTAELVQNIKKISGIETVAHLTCVGQSKAEVAAVVDDLAARGIENILALRGDPPKGETRFVPHADGFAHAGELVGFLRKRGGFCIGVAGYPEKHVESPDMESDLRHLVWKAGQGADFITTQLFFSNADYFRFVERLRAAGVTQPVLPGIMPVTDYEQLKRFTALCGASIPPELAGRLEPVKADREAVVREGVAWAVEQCADLIAGGAPGIHFYTLNRSRSTRDIFIRLREKGLVP